jgi:hypothetical protein
LRYFENDGSVGPGLSRLRISAMVLGIHTLAMGAQKTHAEPIGNGTTNSRFKSVKGISDGFRYSYLEVAETQFFFW